MEKLNVLHFDLDGVLWIPDDFLNDALFLSLYKGKEAGLKLPVLSEGLTLTYAIREAMGPNAQNHFDILVEICNGNSKDLYKQVLEKKEPADVIKSTFPENYTLQFEQSNKHNFFIVQSMVREYNKSKVSNMKPVVNVDDTLDECLKEGYMLSVITNGVSTKQLDKLDELGLTHYFRQKEKEPEVKVIDKHIQVSGDDKSREKPKPYLWEKQRNQFIRYFGTYFQGREAHIGDKYWSDILGANSLGIFSIKVNQGKKKYETIEEVLKKKNIPTREENNFVELLQPDETIDKTTKLFSAIYDIESNFKTLREKKEYQQRLANKLEKRIY